MQNIPEPNSTNFLDMINSPKDIKLLNKMQLKLLASEIRKEIIETTSKTGGHLGAGLGTVELTIALHYMFDSPNDKIIWDVGHQAYPHKLLTGRKKLFHSIRQYKGLAPFLKREESEHDIFGAGHASTAISAALGVAKARDLKKENFNVIAVVGDGALTGGMAFEGLNNTGASKTNILIILNDNRMSISPNVGAISNYLSKIVTDPQYHDKRTKIEHFLKSLPAIGDKAAEAALKLEQNLRAFYNTGMLFKELGFNYYGPINGHNLDDLMIALKNIKPLKGPVLLHIKTQKGEGMKDPENHKEAYHAAKVESIKPAIPAPIKYQDAFANALIKIAAENEAVVGITAAVPSGTSLDKFQGFFPERFFDVGIAEQHAVTFAGGLTVGGIIPVCAIYSTFLQRAFDQIIHDICIQNLHVVFAMDRAGLVGDDGPTHHGSFDISYLRSLPNMTIMAPKDENELQHMLFTAVNHDGPIAIRYPRGSGVGVPIDDKMKSIEIGKAESLRKGDDAIILALGSMIPIALEAAEELEKENIKVGVINARFAKPLDEKLYLHLFKKVTNIITIEENAVKGGFGSAILEFANSYSLTNNIKCLGIPDKFIEHGSVPILRELCGLDKHNLKKVIRQMVR